MVLNSEFADRHQLSHGAGVRPVGEAPQYFGFAARQPMGAAEDVTAFRRRAGLHGHHDVSKLDRLGAPETGCPQGEPSAAAQVHAGLRWMGVDARFGSEQLSRHVVRACRYGTSSRRGRDERAQPLQRLGGWRADGERGGENQRAGTAGPPGERWRP